MNKKIFWIMLLIFVFNTVTVFAENINEIEEDKEHSLTAFQSVMQLPVQDIKVPTMVEVPINFDQKALDSVVVVDKSDDSFVPNLVISNDEVKNITWNALNESTTNKVVSLVDGDSETFTEYAVSNDGQMSQNSIVLKANQQITTSSLTLNLDEFVALPKTIQISTRDTKEPKIILAKTPMRSSTINFPEVTAKSFQIDFEYAQPLRIRELSLNPIIASDENKNFVRFLAHPGKSYDVYFNADRYVKIETGERPNLRSDENVFKSNVLSIMKNVLYTKADSDSDGVPDEIDNCVKFENANQDDIDGNGRGDVCDDFDRDGVVNVEDNCPDEPNRSQKDSDLDKIGDVCDEEESRFFAKYPWLPMTLIIMTGVMVIGLFLIVLKKN